MDKYISQCKALSLVARVSGMTLNAVMSRNEKWFDEHGKLIATHGVGVTFETNALLPYGIVGLLCHLARKNRFYQQAS
jgi:hypothetical protein